MRLRNVNAEIAHLRQCLEAPETEEERGRREASAPSPAAELSSSSTPIEGATAVTAPGSP
jgi:hypothetical protein